MTTGTHRQATRGGGLSRLHISIPADDLIELERRRDENGLTVSAIAARLIHDALKPREERK